MSDFYRRSAFFMTSMTTFLFLSSGCSTIQDKTETAVDTVKVTKQGVRLNAVAGNAEEVYDDMINNKIEDIGYVLSDPHERVDLAYKTKYSTPEIDGKPNEKYDPAFEVNLDNLGFFSIANDKVLRPLLLKSPELGGFSPFNLVITKKKSEDLSYVGHVTPETMLDIVGVTDPDVRDTFIKSFEPLDALVQKEIGGTVEYTSYSQLPAKPLMKFELTFERPDDIVDFIDEFQETFEEAFEEKDYIIAGYKNFSETYEDLELPFDRYDGYWVYSLCHFQFSYNLFNKGRPDAAVFAPCSMYMYIEKDSNVLHIGMPSLQTWVAVMGMTDPDKIKMVNDLDVEIVGIMKKLGAKEL